MAASANAKVLSEIFGLDARMHSEIEVLETDPERLLATRGVPALIREAKVLGGKALAEDVIARLLASVCELAVVALGRERALELLRTQLEAA